MKEEMELKHLIDYINTVKISNDHEAEDKIGEALYKFLFDFLTFHNMNLTEGKVSYESIAMKITGILLQTDGLDEILSSTVVLYQTLLEIIQKLYMVENN